MLIIILVFAVLYIAGLWKVFEKAGEPGWLAIFPVYNWVIALKIAGISWALIIILFLPITILHKVAFGEWSWMVLYVFMFAMISVLQFAIGYGTARNFRKSVWYAVLTGIFPYAFFPLLGYDDSEYAGKR